MSIINDALKKTQQNLMNNQSSEKINTANTSKIETPAPPTSNSKPVNSQEKVLKKFYLTLAIVLAVVTAWILITVQSSWMIANKILQSRSTTPEAAPTQTQNDQPLEVMVTKTSDKESNLSNTQPVTDTPPASDLKVTAPDLVINGIMEMGEKNAALINDEIYEVGDKVNGFEIKRIDLKSVELTDGTNSWTIDATK